MAIVLVVALLGRALALLLIVTALRLQTVLLVAALVGLVVTVLVVFLGLGVVLAHDGDSENSAEDVPGAFTLRSFARMSPPRGCCCFTKIQNNDDMRLRSWPAYARIET